MAQKLRKSRVSSGKTKAINIAREERRQARFARKREEGLAYEYESIPFVMGTEEYYEEEMARAEKTKSRKLPLARFTSIMKKLDNQLVQQKQRLKNNKGSRKATV
ncbi:MAG: hypothetical protein WCR36_07395 [Bacteroidaceae bacterium]